MGTNSKIDWTDHTWNPWRGCTKVSPGCDNCYMMRDAKRYGHEGTVLQRCADKTFRAPLSKKWKADDKVFVCSWSDFFHPDADTWRAEAWQIIRSRPDLIFQILTKRSERITRCLPNSWGNGWHNVWLGVTAENQHFANTRISELLTIPAALRFVSIEPILGFVDLNHIEVDSSRHFHASALHEHVDGNFYNADHLLDWVIVGGESGPKARPVHPDWIRSLRDQCQAAEVPFMFKQWGEWAPDMELVDRMRTYMRMEDDGVLRDKRTRFICVTPEGLLKHTHSDRDEFMTRIGKKYAGCRLDDREWKEFPVFETAEEK